MKILMIIPWLYRGGAEKLVLETCIELNKKNNIIAKVVSFKDDNSYSYLSDKLDWHVIPSHVNLSIYKKNKYDLKRLESFIKKFNPDIIHTHLWESELITRFINYKNAKWFSHFHDNMNRLNKRILPTKSNLCNQYERRLLLRNYQSINNNFICISNYTFNFALKVLPKVLHKNIYILPNSINYKKYYEEVRSKFSTIKIINIGRIDKNKNQKLIVDITKEIVNKGYEVKTTIIGNGPKKNELIKYVDNQKLTKNIKLLGITKNIPKYLKENNFYLHTAISEGFGLTILESMASGLPVVTLDAKGNRDFINHDKNGYIFKNQNPIKFANKIIDLFNNEYLYKKISLNGQLTAKKYDINIYAKNLLEIYKNSINN